MKNLKYFILPYLLLIIPLSELFKNNSGEIFSFDFLVLCFAFAIAVLLLFFIFVKTTKNKDRSSLALSVLCAVLLLSAQLPSHVNFVWLGCVFLSLFLLFIPFRKTFTIPFALTIPLMALFLYNMLAVIKTKYAIYQEIAQHTFTPPLKQKDTQFAGNIYVIILDEFISEKAFNEYYHFDNSDFFNYLREKNFQVIPDSTSNYPWTITSVSSILNMDYHHTSLSKNAFSGVAHSLIKHGNLFNILRNEGYLINHIPSVYWFGNPSTNLFSDCIFRTRSYGLIESLSKLTPLKSAYRSYQKCSHYDHVSHQLSQLKHFAEKPGKQLVFTHILCPHRPIIFDENGNFLDCEDPNIEKDLDHIFYLKQAKYMSHQIAQTIEHILNKSSTPPLIILLSDHGKFPKGLSPKGNPTLPIEDLAWRFSNLQAFYLPGSPPAFNSNSTPINSLRMIISHYFGYDLPQLENNCCYHFIDLNKSSHNSLIINNMK